MCYREKNEHEVTLGYIIYADIMFGYEPIGKISDFIKRFNTVLDESADQQISIFELMNINQDGIVKVRNRLLELALVNRRFFKIVNVLSASDRGFQKILSMVIDSEEQLKRVLYSTKKKEKLFL